MGLTNPLPATPTSPPLPDIQVHIDELTLNGFERINHDQVAAAFQRELSRLLRRRDAAEALPASGAPLTSSADSAYDLISGLMLPPTTSARRLGIELARAVHLGLTRTGEAEP